MKDQTRRDFLKAGAMGAAVISASSVFPGNGVSQEKTPLAAQDPRKRKMHTISTAELERRWKAVREMMKRDRIDYLIIRNDESFLGGPIKWFTDLPASTQYPVTAIFPVDEEMSLISHGAPAPGEPGPAPWAVRGVKRRLSSNYFPSALYTNPYDAELAVSVLKEKRDAVIGFVGKAFIPLTFFEFISKGLPGAKFVDATDQIDHLMTIKSPEEIELIKSVAALQDKAMDYVRKTIRPGKKEFEVFADAQFACSMQGSYRYVILVGSGPQGTAVSFMPNQYQNRTIQDGDQVTILIEVNGPSGLWTELGRVITFGKPCQELQDAFGAALEAQKITLGILKPGASPKEAWDANNAFLEKKGFFPERRAYAHGQGYHFVERPLIRNDETMKIQAGMNLTVHPTASNRTVWAGLTDNFIITESGPGPCIHNTPKKIIEI
jgi:Xaa-Pro aminopeptidase